MPMLTTFAIGLPVTPLHSPLRTASANADIRSSTVVHLGDHVDPVDDERAVARHPQRDVQHGTVLRDVDVLAGEHRVAPLRHAALLGERDEQAQRLVGDPVLRVVEEEPGRLCR